MDPFIAEYLAQNYMPDLVVELHRSFELLEAYNIVDHETAILDLLMTAEYYDPNEIYDGVLMAIRSQLKAVLQAHTIVLHDETTIPQYNEWAEAFKLFEDLDDYSTIARWLESSMPADALLPEIIAFLSTQSVTECWDQLADFDENLLDEMRAYIAQQDQKRVIEQAETVADTDKILMRLKALQDYLKDERALGVRLAASGFLPGRPIHLYKGVIGLPWQETNVRQLAIDIFSIILLSDEHALPISQTYRQYSGVFLNQLSTIQKVDIEIVKLSLGFADYEKAMTAPTNTANTALDAVKALAHGKST